MHRAGLQNFPGGIFSKKSFKSIVIKRAHNASHQPIFAPLIGMYGSFVVMGSFYNYVKTATKANTDLLKGGSKRGKSQSQVSI